MSYVVKVTREGSNWLAEVPDLDGSATFAKSLRGLRTSVREIIILMADLEDDADPDFRFEYELGDQTATDAAHIGDERVRIADREREIQRDAERAARSLVDAGYSHRDAAVLLHMTPGRVSQLVTHRERAEA